MGQQPTQGKPPVIAKGAPGDWLILCGYADDLIGSTEPINGPRTSLNSFSLGGMSLDGITFFLRTPMCAVKRDWRMAHPRFYEIFKPL